VYREVTHGRYDASAPAGEVRVEGLTFQAAQRKAHGRLAILREPHGRRVRVDAAPCRSLHRIEPRPGLLRVIEGL
jgi:hypothetical protein